MQLFKQNPVFHDISYPGILLPGIAIFSFLLNFHLDFKNVIKYPLMLSKFLHFLWKLFFRMSATSLTKVLDGVPWLVTWSNLSNLIGWSQQTLATSRVSFYDANLNLTPHWNEYLLYANENIMIVQ